MDLNPQGSQCLLYAPCAVLQVTFEMVDAALEYVSDYVPSISFLIALIFLLLRLTGFYIVILTLAVGLRALLISSYK